MPTYEYECKNCNFHFETEQSIKEEALKECPECKTDSLQRLIGLGNFILKGEGWYRDGYTKKTNE